MPGEFCPRCRTTTNMIVTVAPKGITGKDGMMKMTTIKTYHCESCRSFVRSMDEEYGKYRGQVRFAAVSPCIRTMRVKRS